MKTMQRFAVVVLMSLLAVAPAPAAAVPDRLTPSDAEVIVQVNVRRMLQTPLIQKHALNPLKSLLEHNAETCRLLRTAGLDPFKDIDTISFSASGHPMSGGKLLIVVRGNFNPGKSRVVAEDYAEKHPDRLKCLTDAEVTMWEIRSDNKSLYAAFADDKTLIITASKKDIPAVVRRVGQEPQRPNAAMQAALAHLKGSENIWLALTATDEIKQLFQSDDTFKEFAAALQSVTGALELSNDAQLELVVHTNSAQAAAQFKNKLDDLMPLLSFLGAGKDKSSQIAKEAIDSIQLKTDKNDVSIRLRVSDAQLEKARRKDGRD